MTDDELCRAIMLLCKTETRPAQRLFGLAIDRITELRTNHALAAGIILAMGRLTKRPDLMDHASLMLGNLDHESRP